MAYREKERDLIVRGYFRAEAQEEAEFCPRCGEALDFQLSYPEADSALLTVRCPDCDVSFQWRPRTDSRPWKDLHIAYFAECHRKARPLRCPIDDSSIIYREHSDGLMEFRCPYCNRSGSQRRSGTSKSHPSAENVGTSD